jgi:hypothetical protein
MMLPVYVAKNATTAEFVAFWAQYYSYRLEHLYTDNIGRPFTSKRVHALYEWKNGSRLAAPKLRSVERNYISRIAEVRRLAPNTTAEEFLRRFPSGGAIWRIFWLHCWQPDRFPIYDQHVHRAMAYIEQRRLEEIPASNVMKVQSYIERYLPFHQRFQGINARSVDCALWFYGKFVKSARFPLP